MTFKNMCLKLHTVLTVEVFRRFILHTAAFSWTWLTKLRLGVQALQHLRDLSAGGAPCQKTSYD